MLRKKARRTIGILCAIGLILFLIGPLAPSAAEAAEKTGNGSLLIINKSINKLAYFKDGVLQRTFPVATGKTKKLTPEGTFPIVNKIKNRPYYTDNIPGGDPSNPLGDRWMGLHVGKTYGTTYAIHGNNNPKSIGKYVSKGCIRMYNDDIHWLFDQIEVGTEVVITSSDLSFEKLAEKHGYDLLKPMEASLVLKDEPVAWEKQLFIYKGKTYLPLRACFELLGGVVEWDAGAKQVRSTVGEHTIIHKPDTKIVTVDGAETEMEAPSRNWDGTVMIPLRDMAALTGWNVHWDPETSTIYIF